MANLAKISLTSPESKRQTAEGVLEVPPMDTLDFGSLSKEQKLLQLFELALAQILHSSDVLRNSNRSDNSH
ncbi:hypothetical protein Aduo_013556 [Ancylostoma duodenale]